MLDRRILEISGILIFIWSTLIALLLFIDVYIVTLQIPFVGYFWRVLTGIFRTIISVGLFVIWLILWKTAVGWYFNKVKSAFPYVKEVPESNQQT